MNCRKKIRVAKIKLTLFLFFFLILPTAVKSHNHKNSDFIGIGKYMGLSQEDRSILKFKIVKVLRGGDFPSMIFPLRYHVEKEGSMPKLSTLWIIFVSNGCTVNGAFDAYESNRDLSEYNEKRLDATLNLIEKIDEERKFDRLTRKNMKLYFRKLLQIN